MQQDDIFSEPSYETTAVATMNTMSFPDAIRQVIAGRKITKLEWIDRGIYGMLRDCRLMLYRDDKWFLWIINEGDLLGTDWVVLGD